MDNNEIMTTAEITPQERAVLLDSRINVNVEILKNTVREAANTLFAIGRDLKTMRDEKLYIQMGHKTFADYCNEKADVKQRQAYNYIKCYEIYGERLNTELANIENTKLIYAAMLDTEDREQLIESGELDNMSTNEVKKYAQELKSRTAQITLELDEKTKELSRYEKMQNDFDKLKSELDANQSVKDKQSARIAELEEKNRSMAKYETELKDKITELMNKPVEVAVEKPSKAEIEKIKKDAAEKAEKAAKKQHDKEIAELRERMAAAEKANAEKIERLESENASLPASPKRIPPSTQKERIKFYAEECLRNFNAALEAVRSLPEDERDKPMATMKNMAAKMTEALL